MGATDTIKAAASGAVAQTGQNKSVFGFMEQHKNQIAKALPQHMSAERMVRVATTCFRMVPKLLECTPESLFGAIIQCSQLGLEPGNGLGHAYLIPFDKNKKISGVWTKIGTDVQLIIGYKGLLDLARRSGNIQDINAFPVYEGDEFELTLGLKPNIQHKPNFGHVGYGDPEKVVFVYAVANLVGGGVQFRAMSRKQVEKIRARSKSKDNGPWITDWEPMALKTVLRQLCNWLPLSVEIQRSIEQADPSAGGSEFIFDPNAIDGDFVRQVEPENQIDDNAPTFQSVLAMIDTAATDEDFAVIRDMALHLKPGERKTVESAIELKDPNAGRQF